MLFYVLTFQLLRSTLKYTQTKGPSCWIVVLHIEDKREKGEYSQLEENSSDTRRESLEPLLSVWSRLKRFSVTFEEFIYFSDGIATAGTFSDEEICDLVLRLFTTTPITNTRKRRFKSDLTWCTVTSSIQKWMRKNVVWFSKPSARWTTNLTIL